MAMLQSCSYRELGHESIQSTTIVPCKRHILHSPFSPRIYLGFAIYNHNLVKSQSFPRLYSPPCSQISDSIENSHAQKFGFRGTRVYPGFKVNCHSKTLALPSMVSSFNGRKKKYGGSLPLILRSLESDNLERTLKSLCENLNPKEQTVILKEQRNWIRVNRAFEFFKSLKDYVPNVIHYNVVLRALGRAQQWDELRLCWMDMAKDGVMPTNNTYGMLVDVYGKAGLVKESLLWIKHMRLRGIFPDEVTMNTVLKVLKDAGEFDRADRFYRGWCNGRAELDDIDWTSMVDFKYESGSAPISFKHFLSTELFKTGGRNPSLKMTSSSKMDNLIRKPRLTSTYNTLIDLYGKAGRLKDAANVFGEMLRSGVAMDTITFNTMIFTCGNHGFFPEAESLLTKMEERGISPDTKTYNILLSLYAEAGHIHAALKCYRKIREVGLYPDVVTHRAVLHVLCERNMVREVETVLEEMEKAGNAIDEHSLPAIMKMYIDEGLLEQAKIFYEKNQLDDGFSSKTRAAIMDAYAEKRFWAEAESVFFGKRDSIGQNRDVVEYNVMIKAYGKANVYDKAFSLFKSMRTQGTWPDECTYNSLIQMFASGDMVEEAGELLAEMLGVGYKPQCLTFSAVIASYSRVNRLSDAVDVHQEMERHGVKQNEVVYGSLINGFAEAGMAEEALQYFRRMEESGIPANLIILTSLIKAYSKLGCLEGATAIYDRMKGLEGGLDVVALNSMISLYTDFGMVSEAKLVFENLREKGWADGVSFATMMHLYKSMGMLDEAIDVADEMKQSGLLRDCDSYNTVMAFYATNGQLLECGELLHEMVTKKLLPDKGTFKVLGTILSKGGMAIEAITQIEESYMKGKPYSRQAVMTSVFSVVGMHDLALESCEILMKADVPLDSFAYNVAIYAYGASGKVDKALELFMKMQGEGLEPDVVTYINLVYCYAKAGMTEGIKRIYSQLKYEKIEPNQSLFTAITSAYSNVHRHDLAQLVKQEMNFIFDLHKPLDSDMEDNN